MVVSESKADASYPDSQFHIPGYHLHHQDRKKGVGRVLVLVSSKIESRRIKIDRKYKTIEIIALHIALTTRNLILLAIYRPPRKVTEVLSSPGLREGHDISSGSLWSFQGTWRFLAGCCLLVGASFPS